MFYYGLQIPQKTSENQRFSDVFRGYINRTLDENGNERHEGSDIKCQGLKSPLFNSFSTNDPFLHAL